MRYCITTMGRWGGRRSSGEILELGMSTNSKNGLSLATVGFTAEQPWDRLQEKMLDDAAGRIDEQVAGSRHAA